MSHPNSPGDPRISHDISAIVARLRKNDFTGYASPDDTSFIPRQRGPITAGLDPYTGNFGKEELAFLLKRCMVGVTTDDLNTFSGLTMEQAVDVLLQEKSTPPLPVNDYYEAVQDPNVAPLQTWVEAPWNVDVEGARIISFKSWMVKQLLDPAGSIHEKLILFWHNHFVTESWGVFTAKSTYQYFDTLRTMAFGNFKDLTRAMTLAPAMLVYLNGNENSKNAPDENYARELQELFCIGKGPDSGYTEMDVQSAAKVLTGWKVNWLTVINEGRVASEFFAWDHDTSDKQFSGFYNDGIIVGQTGAQGANELDALLELIFGQIETARHICRRLYQCFVYTDIDEMTEENVIRPLADELIAVGWEIRPILRSLLMSQHFFHVENRGAMIKHPADALLGLWRGLGMQLPGNFNESQQMEAYQAMMWQMEAQGMELGDPPAVAGWPAYHQAPIFDNSWITTNTITNRALQSDSMVYWGLWNPVEPVVADLIEFTKTLEHPEDPNQLIEETCLLFLGIPLSEGARQDLKDILLSGQQNDSYWTIAWNGMIASPTNEQLRQLVNLRLQLYYHTLFQFAEFQLI